MDVRKLNVATDAHRRNNSFDSFSFLHSSVSCLDRGKKGYEIMLLLKRMHKANHNKILWLFAEAF